MYALPTGIVTFLFTDIEGSTRLWQEHPVEMKVNHVWHNDILRAAIEDNHGYIFQIIGDSYCAAFHRPAEAIKAAVKAQQNLNNVDWGEAVIKVRMGVHTGEAVVQSNGEYQGYLTLSRVQRLMSAGHGGQVLISQSTRELISDEMPDGVSLRDMGERHLKDLIRSEHIYQLSILGLITDFPALKTLDIYRHNLPIQLTNFIGRDRELMEIKQSLYEHRLVTLIGAGGTGKTRLSLQVAAELVDQYPDGVYFVELASISDPDLIPQTILNSIGNQAQQGITVHKSLIDFLHEKTSLLVLDNCEHLIDACAKLVETLLTGAPNVKILTSSREALGIKGEIAWHVPSLSIPDPNDRQEPEQLSKYEAVRLFIDRAVLVQPKFMVTDENAYAVAQICSRLDGIPLAIELAAARLKVLTVEQIASRLDDRFRLLTGGSRTTLPRQQTLRALIDWSYDLLSEKESLLLRRLAVFIGGWSIESVEHICSDDQLEQFEVLDTLSRLVDKSLVAVSQNKTETRYRMLEIIHQYAREKFYEIEDSKSLLNRHSNWYLKLTQEAEPHLEAVSEKFWLDRLLIELDNLRAAFEWLLANKSIDALRIAVFLGRFWVDRDLFTEGRSFLKRAQDANQETIPELTAKALMIEGQLSFHQGDFNIAKEQLKKALNLADKIDDQNTTATILNSLGLVSWSQASLTEARNYFEKSLKIRRKLENKQQISVILGNLGVVAYSQEDYMSARHYHQESERTSRELGDKYALAATLNNLGIDAEALGDDNAAYQYYMESLNYSREMNSKLLLAYTLNSLAHLFLKKEDLSSANNTYLESLTVFREIGEKRGLAYCFEGLARVNVLLGNIEHAVILLAIAEKLRELIGAPLPSNEKTEYDEAISATQEKLGQNAFTAAWLKGSSMNVEQAIEFILRQ